MTGFHCVLQAAPNELPDAEALSVEGKSMQVLTPPNIETRFRRSFEAAALALEKLPRFFFEPDGSFVWVIDRNDIRYQLDGSLYDDGERLLNVELKGTCDAITFDQFLACLGWPEEMMLFQLVQHGVYLNESEFRKHYVS